MTGARVLVAGVGNVLLGDDGFGSEVARRLQAQSWPDGVRVMDYGIRGVDLAFDLMAGYDVAVLVDQIQSVLGLTERRAVALVGVGNLGHALAGYAGFTSRGFRFAALLDADRSRVGERINGLPVHHIDDLDTVVMRRDAVRALAAETAAAAPPVVAAPAPPDVAPDRTSAGE